MSETAPALAEWLNSLNDADLVELARQLGGRQQKRETALAFVASKPEAGIRAAWAVLSEPEAVGANLALIIEADDAKTGRLRLPFTFSYNKDYVIAAGRNVLPRHVAEHISKWLKESRVFHQLVRV